MVQLQFDPRDQNLSSLEEILVEQLAKANANNQRLVSSHQKLQTENAALKADKDSKPKTTK